MSVRNRCKTAARKIKRIVAPRRGHGVLYLALGESCLAEAAESLKSLKRVSPKLHVTLLTDEPHKGNGIGFDRIEALNRQANPFRIKVDCLERSPYEVTLFIDTDTIVTQPIDEVFELFEGFDFAICREPYKTRTRPREFIGYEDPFHMNSGVFLYRNSESFATLWKFWKELTEKIPEDQMRPRGPASDQGPCNHALQKASAKGCRILVLDNRIYNARIIAWPHLLQDGLLSRTKILHGRGAQAFLDQSGARTS